MQPGGVDGDRAQVTIAPSQSSNCQRPLSTVILHKTSGRTGLGLALPPIATFGLIKLAHQLFPGMLPAEQFSPWMLLVAATVVIGSVITARG
jgi:hypothetical protein